MKSISFVDRDGDKIVFDRYEDGEVIANVVHGDTCAAVLLDTVQLAALAGFLCEDEKEPAAAARPGYIVRSED